MVRLFLPRLASTTCVSTQASAKPDLTTDPETPALYRLLQCRIITLHFMYPEGPKDHSCSESSPVPNHLVSSQWNLIPLQVYIVGLGASRAWEPCWFRAVGDLGLLGFGGLRFTVVTCTAERFWHRSICGQTCG